MLCRYSFVCLPVDDSCSGVFFFFFQAEDGIRDLTVTGVQTCALPIWIGGLRALARALARSGLPVVLTPGVIHLTSVPEHRKINRVDMGTADKVCVAALAIAAQAERSSRPLDKVSLVLLELGGAFTAAIAVAGGKIVDGAGGSAGPLGVPAAGALDGGGAYPAGALAQGVLFPGGAARVPRWAAGAASSSRQWPSARPAARCSIISTSCPATRPGGGWVSADGARAHRRGLDPRLRRVGRAGRVRRGRRGRVRGPGSRRPRGRGARRPGARAVQHAGGDRRRPCARVRRRGVRGKLREPPSRRARPGRAAPALGQRPGGAGPGARSPAA